MQIWNIVYFLCTNCYLYNLSSERATVAQLMKFRNFRRALWFINCRLALWSNNAQRALWSYNARRALRRTLSRFNVQKIRHYFLIILIKGIIISVQILHEGVSCNYDYSQGTEMAVEKKIELVLNIGDSFMCITLPMLYY